MKLHRNLAHAVIAGLKSILLDKNQADSTVIQLLQSNSNWGARDRNFIADNIYTIVRYKRMYEFCMEEEMFGEVSLWKLFGIKLLIEEAPLPEWKEFELLDKEKVNSLYQQALQIRKVRESVPDWLDELGEKELGDIWEKEIAALNKPAMFSIRVNSIKSNVEVIKRLFTDDNIPFTETNQAPDGLVIKTRKNFRNYPAYKNGLFEVQDIASQLVAPLLSVASGMMVIDGCAGAGGKTLHIAALMQNKGDILAIDVNEDKLSELEKRAIRAGVKIINVIAASKITQNTQGRLQHTADRILLDVPCSGLGVLRRKPDAKWTLTKKFLDELVVTQASILDEYAPMLKRGGVLVYSTCSIMPCENQQQIEKFLQRNNDFQLLEERSISPADTGFDGFYMAKLSRK